MHKSSHFNIDLKQRKRVLFFYLAAVWTICGFSQEREKAAQLSDQYIYKGNAIVGESFVAAEKNYRIALSEMPSNIKGAYNLGHAYYAAELYDEALARLNAAAKSGSKVEKHRAYHNIGNALMQRKQCKKAVEAFKNALRNNPSDDESRYNLALAQECAKEKGGGGEDKDNQKDKDNKNDSDKKQDQEDKNKEENDSDKASADDGDKKKEKGKPKDKSGDKNDDNKKKPEQQPGKLSKQQIKSLLEAMNNEEKKVQEKMNATKEKGIKVQTEKDW